MTDIQKVEFGLLESFVKICDDLGLMYYLVCGSALGAVKYKGFIPWDDDVDVALPREDYERFCDLAPEHLPEGVFLQNHKTDKLYPRIYSKLRNSNTTYIEKTTKHIDMNHGVFIDIFPLDGYPESEKDIARLERQKKILKLKIECVFNVDYGFLRNSFFRLERMLGFHKKTNKYVKRLDKILSAYPSESSSLWCNHGNWQGKLEYAPREQYGKGAFAEFEGLSVRVPEKYDEYLTQKYGNWRADLPEEEQVGHHYYEICDMTKPYTHYMKIKKDK
ncbi:MAG: LicD family protein [Clostridia bacterium]|nr:LicD family protein [Clostridia bacterium]